MTLNIFNENTSHKKVFISGSQTQDEITNEIKQSLDLIKSQSFEILIGDSNKGIDNEVAKYLKKGSVYPLVNVFSISNRARFKIEDTWTFIQLCDELKTTPRVKQMQKDRIMAEQVDYGLVIFDPISINRYGKIEVSSGTLRNAIQMLKNNKPVKFFYVYENKMQSLDLKKLNDLEKVIKTYMKEQLTPQDAEKIKDAKRNADSNEACIIKYSRIYEKYVELCKKELEEEYNDVEREIEIISKKHIIIKQTHKMLKNVVSLHYLK